MAQSESVEVVGETSAMDETSAVEEQTPVALGTVEETVAAEAEQTVELTYEQPQFLYYRRPTRWQPAEGCGNDLYTVDDYIQEAWRHILFTTPGIAPRFQLRRKGPTTAATGSPAGRRGCQGKVEVMTEGYISVGWTNGLRLLLSVNKNIRLSSGPLGLALAASGHFISLSHPQLSVSQEGNRTSVRFANGMSVDLTRHSLWFTPPRQPGKEPGDGWVFSFDAWTLVPFKSPATAPSGLVDVSAATWEKRGKWGGELVGECRRILEEMEGAQRVGEEADSVVVGGEFGLHGLRVIRDRGLLRVRHRHNTLSLRAPHFASIRTRRSEITFRNHGLTVRQDSAFLEVVEKRVSVGDDARFATLFVSHTPFIPDIPIPNTTIPADN